MIVAAGISMGPVGPVPWFAEPATDVLVGKPASPAQFEKAADVILKHISLRTSKYRATLKYREAMIRTYLPIILTTAAQRAGAEL
jgi:CO/xanthine dehydrogenase FAD-binding subunit